MCFHSSAFAVGMTKNGEIKSTRTTPRPGNGASTRSARPMPPTTVIAITEPSSTIVFHTEGPKSGSVTKNSKFSSPRNVFSPGCIRL